MIEKKYLGIDWGEKRIGLAVGDDVTKLAVPYGLVKNLEEVLLVIREEEIEAVVIGQPLMLSGHSDFIKPYQDFLNSLQEKTNIEIISRDERLSSRAADALSGTKKDKADRDSIAAMLILQGFFDMSQ